MSYFNRQRTNLNEYKRLLENLRSRLLNENLLKYIAEKLDIAQMDNTFTFLSDHEAEILDSKNGDSFLLRIGEDEIHTFMTCWNNHHRKQMDIKFFGDVIAVKTDSSTDIVNGIPGMTANTTRQSKVEVYHNDLLFCVKTLESITDSSLGSLKCSTTVSETFVNDKGEAVKKVITDEDKESQHKTEANYYYSADFQVPPFQTVGCEEVTYKEKLREISEEAYNSFIAGLTDKRDNVYKKLYPKELK